MDEANEPQVNENSGDMDTSTTVLGKPTRSMEVSMDTGLTGGETIEKRPRYGAMELALAVDLKVAKQHAQRWHPELKPKVGAH